MMRRFQARKSVNTTEKAGLSTLNEGQTVEYEIVSDRGKESAGNLKVK
jgi:CspA family cold shock protein